MSKRFEGEDLDDISLAQFLGYAYKYTDKNWLRETEARLDDLYRKPHADIKNPLLSILSENVACSSARTNVRRQAENIARNILSRSESIAFGTCINENGNNIREIIPAEFWDSAKINWKDNSASDEIDSYFRIRVTNQVALQKPFQSSGIERLTIVNETAKASQIGRPSQGPLIEKSIKECIEKNPKFAKKTRSKQRQIVRSHINSLKNDIDPYNDAGFSDQALNKYLQKASPKTKI